MAALSSTTRRQEGPSRRARPRRRLFARSQSGSSFPLGFMVAGMVFAASTGVLLAATQQAPAGRDQAMAADQAADAQSILDMLIGRPGDWTAGGDAPAIVGLRNDNGTGLDPVRIAYLQGAGLTPALNGFLESDELLVSMGLDTDAYGVHIRITPMLDIVPLEVNHQHASMRTAYIGDWSGLPATTVTLGTDAEMVAAARANLETTASAAALQDRKLLLDLSFGFNNTIHLGSEPVITVDIPLLPDLPLTGVITDPSTMVGDVLPDQKQYLNAVLPVVLPGYDMLVIGTGVDHNSLTSTAVKNTIATWVQGGGMVVVFGSPSASSNWIQPIYHVTTESESGDTSAPDLSHGVLSHPYPLQWADYLHTGTAWDLSALPPDQVEDVLVSDDSAILSYLSGGPAGSGHVVLTSLNFAQIATQMGELEAQRLLTNLVANLRNVTLYPLGLDYGGPVPTDIPVSVARGKDLGWFPGYGFVPVQVEVLLWRTMV